MIFCEIAFFRGVQNEAFLQTSFVQLLKIFQGCGDNGTENDNGPGQVHPNQKDGQGGQGAVESFVSGGHGYGAGEAFTEQPEQNNCDQSTEKGVFDMNFFVGNQHINQKQQKRLMAAGRRLPSIMPLPAMSSGIICCRVNR